MSAFTALPAGGLASLAAGAAQANRSSPRAVVECSAAAPGAGARFAGRTARPAKLSSRPAPSQRASEWRNTAFTCHASGTSDDVEGSDMNDLMAQLGGIQAFGAGSGLGPDDLPSQGQSVVAGTDTLPSLEDFRPPSDLDYLQELSAIQKEGPKMIGFFGTRNMGFLHQQLIEILSYAMVLTKNHIYTSGATGTNAAVIRGALRAEAPELLTVVLPQSKSKQPPESQELLEEVQQVIEMPQNDDLSLLEASRICNQDILSRVQQVICFAFHDSKLLLETCREAKHLRKIVTLFYLD